MVLISAKDTRNHVSHNVFARGLKIIIYIELKEAGNNDGKTTLSAAAGGEERIPPHAGLIIKNDGQSDWRRR